MRTASLRFRITAIAVVTVAVVLALAAIVVVAAQRGQLTATLDATLAQRANDIEALLAAPDFQPTEFGETRQAGFTQLVAADGTVLAASPNLLGLPALPLVSPSGPADVLATSSRIPLDDDAYRVLTRAVMTAGVPATLHVGTAYDDVGDSTEALTTTLTFAIPLLTLMLGGIIWWLVGRTIKPVEDIRAEVAAIGGGELDRRVPQPTSDDEVARLAATMNDMLDRIEQAVAQQQRFAADASHELRSPLTRLRTDIEVDLAAAPDEAVPRLKSLRDDVVALQHLVEDLLHLARSDAGSVAPAQVPVDLDDLVLDEVRALRAVTDKAVDISDVSAAQVIGDAPQLRRAIRNVIENADRHGVSSIDISLGEFDGVARLVVVDDGPGVDPADAEHIFERFGRVDESRARSSGGTGLGLAITRDIVTGHGGTIELDAGHYPGAKFVISIAAANTAYLM